MDSQQDLDFTRRLLHENAMLAAMAYDAIHGYKSDDVSQIQAYDEYGVGWIKDRTERGLLHWTRQGKTEKSPKIYSRYEIELLKRSEKFVSDMYVCSVDRSKRLVDGMFKKISNK